MKKKGSKSDFTAERNAELRAVFFSQAAYATDNISLQKTINTPSSRFWVEPERARDVISRIEKDPSSLNRMQPRRRRMYATLLHRYQTIRTEHPGLSKIDSVTMAIYSQAPEFFISPSTARGIIYS